MHPRSYMQSSAYPARDVFTRLTSGLVSSLVVVPLVACDGGEAAGCLGALYLTCDAPYEWGNVQEPLLVRCAAVQQPRPLLALGRPRAGGCGRGACARPRAR